MIPAPGNMPPEKTLPFSETAKTFSETAKTENPTEKPVLYIKPHSCYRFDAAATP